jgi:hypothetical protein
MASGPFLPTLLLLGLAGTSIIRGDFMVLGGASMTIGVGFKEALMLGARLRLLALEGALEGAIDILVSFALLLLGVKFEEALDDVSSGLGALLKEATVCAEATRGRGRACVT